MDYAFEKIVDLAREIFEKSANVSKYTVHKIGAKYIVKIYDNKGTIAFGMKGNYNNVKHVCKLILKEQETNGGKLYELQGN